MTFNLIDTPEPPIIAQSLPNQRYFVTIVLCILFNFWSFLPTPALSQILKLINFMILHILGTQLMILHQERTPNQRPISATSLKSFYAFCSTLELRFSSLVYPKCSDWLEIWFYTLAEFS